MIRVNGRDITSIVFRRSLTAVYKGATLVWCAVKSCFGAGVWRHNKPWLDDERWKDNQS